jgi:hypothetical protein
MEYTYCHDIQGNDRNTHYLKMCFDRLLTNGRFYQRQVGTAPEKEQKLLNIIEKTPNVVPVNAVCYGPGLILVDGCEITARIVTPVGKVRVAEIASQLAKKIQRRFAKGESRKRVLHSVVKARQEANNLKTWGKDSPVMA